MKSRAFRIAFLALFAFLGVSGALLGAATLGPSGTGINATLNGAPVAVALNGATEGGVLTAHGTGVLPTFDPPAAGFTAGGDLDGGVSSQTVVGLRSRAIDTATPTIGNTYYWTGSLWSPAAVNLAGGSGYVANALPNTNLSAPLATLANGSTAQIPVENAGATGLAMVSVTGDCAITSTGVLTCSKINGTSVPAGGSLTTGNACYVSGSSACTYAALNLAGGAGYVTGVLPAANQAAQTMTGDVTGTTGANLLSTMTGTSFNDYRQDAGSRVTGALDEMCFAYGTNKQICTYDLTTILTDATTWVVIGTNGTTINANTTEGWGLTYVAADYSGDGGVRNSANFAMCSVTFAAIALATGSIVGLEEQGGGAGGGIDGGDLLLSPVSCTGLSGCTSLTDFTGCVKGTGPSLGVRVHNASGVLQLQMTGVAGATWKVAGAFERVTRGN